SLKSTPDLAFESVDDLAHAHRDAFPQLSEEFRVERFPAFDFADDLQGMDAAVGPRRIARELLVGDIGVVLERAGGHDEIHPWPAGAPGHVGGQPGALWNAREVDVVHHHAVVVVGPEARAQQVAYREVGFRPVVERAGHAVAIGGGYGNPVIVRGELVIAHRPVSRVSCPIGRAAILGTPGRLAASPGPGYKLMVGGAARLPFSFPIGRQTGGGAGRDGGERGDPSDGVDDETRETCCGIPPRNFRPARPACWGSALRPVVPGSAPGPVVPRGGRRAGRPPFFDRTGMSCRKIPTRVGMRGRFGRSRPFLLVTFLLARKEKLPGRRRRTEA